MVDFNEIIKRRTKKNVISEIIAIVVFALLNIAFKAYSIEYNVDLLKEQDVYAPYVHKFCETINPKIALKDFVCYDRRLEASINTICENEVGKTLIRRMYDAYLNSKKQGMLNIKLGENNRILSCSKLNYTEIQINPKKLYPCMGYKNGEIIAIPVCVDSVIFHEMCHAFHILAITKKHENFALNYIYKETNVKELWTNDEELYTISGYFYENGELKYDPLNANSYEICKLSNIVTSRNEIFQRIFHTLYFNIKDSKYKEEYLLGLEGHVLTDLSKWVLDKE